MPACPAPRLRDRRRLVRHRRRQGAARARLRLRLLREVGPRRRQLGLRRTRTACRPRTRRCTSTRRASAWSTRTSRCRSPIPTSRTTRTSPRYFDDYVDHFGFRDRIRFETPRRARRAPRRRHAGTSTTARRALRRAARRQRPPLGPALARARLPRRGHASTGVQMHSHDYTATPSSCRGKHVVVLGMGNCAMDIAVDASLRRARRTFLAARRGAHVIPKYLFGRPLDQLGASPKIPFARPPQRSSRGCSSSTSGDMERYGLPKPDHRFGEAHPTISGRILDRARARRDHAEAEHRAARGRPRRASPTAASVARRRRRLLHGLQGHVPVLRRGPDRRARQRPAALPARLPPGHRERVLRRAAPAARRDHAARRGAVAPGSPTTSQGRYALPRRRAMRADMEAERERMFKRYVASKRHTMQVDFDDYLVALDAGAPGGRGASGALATRAVAASPPWRRTRRRGASARRRPTARRSSPRRARCSASSATAPRRVRDIIRRTDLAAGTFYNYFPDKESIFRALVEEIGAEARRRVARGPPRARRARPRSSRTATARTSSSSSRTRRTTRFISRNAGTIRALFDDGQLPLGDRRARGGPRRAAIARGDLPAARRRATRRT